MDFSLLIGVLGSLAAITALSLLFFFYFRNEAFKKNVNQLSTLMPFILGLIGKRVKDKPGVFDTHDGLMLVARVSERIRTTIQDPTNKVFEDVEEEVFDIVRDELRRYEDLPGIPDLEDPLIKAQVRVVFEAVQRAMSEDPD